MPETEISGLELIFLNETYFAPKSVGFTHGYPTSPRWGLISEPNPIGVQQDSRGRIPRNTYPEKETSPVGAEQRPDRRLLFAIVAYFAPLGLVVVGIPQSVGFTHGLSTGSRTLSTLLRPAGADRLLSAD